jgi:hypothetical protein
MQGFKRNQRRSMHVSEVALTQNFGSIELKNEQVGTMVIGDRRSDSTASDRKYDLSHKFYCLVVLFMYQKNM